jgi:hypothetical protein
MSEAGTTQVQTPDGSAVSNTSAFGSPFYQYGSSIQNMTNPKSLLEDLEYQLKGKRKLPGGQIKDISMPLMNEEGINRVMSLVYTIVNRITIMSNLDNNDIGILMLSLSDALIQDLMINGRSYGIKDSVDKSYIISQCQNVAYVCLKRGLNEGERRFWKGSISETRITQDQQAQKKGLLSWINPWSK